MKHQIFKNENYHFEYIIHLPVDYRLIGFMLGYNLSQWFFFNKMVGEFLKWYRQWLTLNKRTMEIIETPM